MLGAPHRPLGAQIMHQLFPKRPTGLNKQAPIDRLMRHAFVLVLAMHSLQPAGDLFGRPIPFQLPSDRLTEPSTARQLTSFRPTGPHIGGFVSKSRTVAIMASIAAYLPAHRRRGPAQNPRHRATGAMGRKPSGDLLPFRQAQSQTRTAARRRTYSASAGKQ